MRYHRPSPDRFAAAVAASLSVVLPAGFTAQSHGASVDVYGRNSSRHASMGASIIIEDDGRALSKLLGTAASGILNGAQDGVMEILTEQWPVGADGRVVYPDARVDGDRLLMWFGEEHRPLLILPPLHIPDIFEGAV